MVSFSRNVVLRGAFFSINLVPKQRMLGPGIYVLGPLHLAGIIAAYEPNRSGTWSFAVGQNNTQEASRGHSSVCGLWVPHGYRSSMKAAPIMTVGKMAHRNNFSAEIPSSPNREARID